MECLVYTGIMLQVSKVEEERVAIERRYKEVVEQGRAEVTRLQQEAARTAASLDKASRCEAEARAQLEDKERLLARLREELDRRVGDLQLEVVEVTAAKQQLEREVNTVRLRLEREKSDGGMEAERLQAEVGAVRARLRAAEDSLVEQRGQNMQLVEAAAALETDLINEKHRREAAEKRKLEEVTRLKTERSEEVEKLRLERISKEKKLRRDNEQLEDLIRRQRGVITELKAQCREVAARFEDSHGGWQQERAGLRGEVAELGQQLQRLEERSLEQARLHQGLLGQISSLQEARSQTQVSRISSHQQQQQQSGHHPEDKVRGITRRKVAAIKVERAGKVKHLISSVN